MTHSVSQLNGQCECRVMICPSDSHLAGGVVTELIPWRRRSPRRCRPIAPHAALGRARIGQHKYLMFTWFTTLSRPLPPIYREFPPMLFFVSHRFLLAGSFLAVSFSIVMNIDAWWTTCQSIPTRRFPSLPASLPASVSSAIFCLTS